MYYYKFIIKTSMKTNDFIQFLLVNFTLSDVFYTNDPC